MYTTNDVYVIFCQGQGCIEQMNPMRPKQFGRWRPPLLPQGKAARNGAFGRSQCLSLAFRRAMFHRSAGAAMQETAGFFFVVSFGQGGALFFCAPNAGKMSRARPGANGRKGVYDS